MKKILVLLSAVLLVTACGSRPSKETSGPQGFQLRPFSEETLPNGLRLLVIKDETLPRFSLTLMVKSGALQDPPSQQGLASMTARMLDQGTAKRKATQLAQEFAQLGSDFSASAQSDWTTVYVSGLTPSAGSVIDLYSEVLLEPAFDAKELERQKSQVLASLEQIQDDPNLVADLLFAKTVFGSHRYGTPMMGRRATIKGLTRGDVQGFYQAHYRPENAMLAVVGNVDSLAMEKLKIRLGAWKASGAANLASTSDRPREMKAERRLITKPGLKQTQVRVGHLGIERTHPDFLALRLGNLILGGGFTSRLNQRIRDDLGLTYSISSAFDARKEKGDFEISTFTRDEKVGEALRETLQLVQQTAEKGVNANELRAAQTLMVGQFPSSIETPDRLAMNLLVLRFYGIPDTYLSEFIPNIQKITAKDVNRALATHVKPESFKILVYGQKAQILPQLESLGPWAIEDLEKLSADF